MLMASGSAAMWQGAVAGNAHGLERRRRAAEAAGTQARGVHGREQLLLERAHARVGRRLAPPGA